MIYKFLNKTNTSTHFLSLLSLGLLTVLMSCDANETQTVATFNNLVWEDNFDVDGAPDASRWGYDLGDGSDLGIPGWGNNELQYYTNRSENVTVQNGFLLITAQEEETPFEGYDYTSARLVTRGLFEQAYGRFEARIRVPYGKGYWPAFWLLGNNCDTNPWPACGEIDIMEYLGDEPINVFGSVHGPGYSGANAVTKEYVLSNSRFDTEFHIFGIEWSPDQINYYVDGDLYQSITPEDVADQTNGEGEWVFNHPFYIILNVAIGGNFPGNPTADTEFPQTMLVDYVRVYQYEQ